eukprot:5386821-Pleurochrysis_carterae.AAC.1
MTFRHQGSQHRASNRLKLPLQPGLCGDSRNCTTKYKVNLLDGRRIRAKKTLTVGTALRKEK